MRTTITIDDDVAVELARIRGQAGASFKKVINDTLRAGLVHAAASRPPRRQYCTRPVSLGRCKLDSIDDTARVIAIVEGECPQGTRVAALLVHSRCRLSAHRHEAAY